jgi:hypothetical protein
VNSEQERMRKGVTMACFEVLFWYLLGESDQITKNLVPDGPWAKIWSTDLLNIKQQFTIELPSLVVGLLVREKYISDSVLWNFSES